MWLVRDGEVLAELERAGSRRARRRGLLGRERFEGALLLAGVGAVHTIGMRFPIDVAYCDRGLRVLAAVRMPPGRIGRPRLAARYVIEAEAGAFDRWHLRPGDVLSVGGEPNSADDDATRSSA